MKMNYPLDRHSGHLAKAVKITPHRYILSLEVFSKQESQKRKKERKMKKTMRRTHGKRSIRVIQGNIQFSSIEISHLHEYVIFSVMQLVSSSA